MLTAEPLDLDYGHEIIGRYTRNVTRPPPSGPKCSERSGIETLTLVAAALVLRRIHDHDRVHECR